MASKNPKQGGRGGGAQKAKKVVERGIVGAVPSGDRIVVYVQEVAPKTGSWQPPKKKEIKLSWIQAPRPSATWYEDDEEHYREPEDFYWESKEFLRSLVIGKAVEITIHKAGDNAVNKAKPDAIPRQLGSVVLAGQKEELSKTIVAAGWAEVRRPENIEKSPQALQDLLALQTEAEASGLGIHASASTKPVKGKQPGTVKKVKKSEPIYDFDHFKQYKDWKDNKLNGIVESVLSGSMVRVILVPSLHSLVVRIAGVRAPIYKKDGSSEPYGKEAHWTAERYTLHRDVEIRLTGFDRDRKEEGQTTEPKTGTFHGEILIKDASVGELLLQHGLASYVDWSAPKDKAEKYRELELSARTAKSRLWGVPGFAESHPAFVVKQPKVKEEVSRGSLAGTKWSGFVKGVISGNTLVIENRTGDVAKLETVTLSSVNAPKLGREHSTDEPLAWEARNFIRKKLIGKRVDVTIDYTVGEQTASSSSSDSKAANSPKTDKDGKPLPPKSYYTVELGTVNIALALIENGFATVLQRSGNFRSPHYDALILAQDRAKKKNVGLHSKNIPKRLINDVSRDSKKAKTLLTGLMAKPKHDAVVEYVIAGNKLKLHLVTESLLVSFVLSGIRTPSVPPKAKAGEQQRPTPPFAVESTDFTRNLVHHYDVQVEIDGQDKTGAFKGYLWKGKQNLGELLLEEGLGERFPCKKYENLLEAAEQRAKNERKRIWADYDPVKEEEDARQREADRVEGMKKVSLEVHVTEVIDATKFYIQIDGDEKNQLDSLMEKIAAKDWSAEPAYTPDRGDVVLAQFSGDEVWYRGKVLFVAEKNAKVFYGDYGNTEFVDLDSIRELPAEFDLKTLKFQARECSLAYVVPRTLTQDYGEDAALLLKESVWDKPLIASVESGVKSSVWQVTLWDDQKTCINGVLVAKGFATVEPRPRNAIPDLIAFLREQEEIAHDKHEGIWVYGDPTGDSD
eukprot:TRINITY_DN5821_c0_g1_i1.p1 TRINITY_DN5821_c0_g1~~TRINITY_DN5821_c0_g1_i1.p1  ORF type:complete len:962 (+),score=342.78 TRINITY_DN5821_c0_g1_i1:206-3091(+)